MAIEPVTRDIAGDRYVYTPLGAKRGMRVFTQLAQRLGGSLGAALGSGTDDKAALGANAIGALVTRLDPDFVESLIDTFAAQTRVERESSNGKTLVNLKDTLDVHFQCRTMAQFEWLEFCLESQYSDFLGWLKGALSSGAQADRKGG